MAKKIRWGILGPGRIARKFAEAVKDVEGAELAAAGSRSAERACKFADEFGIPRRHAGYEALAADGEVDAVYVATPHPMHRDHAILCLEAGKAVLCEKPLTVNAAQAEAVAAAARKHRVFCMEAMWTRFLPAMARLRELLAEGRIGEVRMVQADFGFRAGLDPAGRLFDPALAGGALLDVGVYTVALASMVLGEPTEVAAAADIGATGVDEQSAWVLKYAGGALALLAAAVRTRTPQEAAVIGTEGFIRVHAPWWQAARLTVKAGRDGEQTLDLPFQGNGFNYEIAEAVRCLRAGETESPIMPLDESVSIIRTMDRVRAVWGLKYPGEND